MLCGAVWMLYGVGQVSVQLLQGFFIHFLLSELASNLLKCPAQDGHVEWKAVQMYWKQKGHDFSSQNSGNSSGDSLPRFNDQKDTIILFCHGGGFCVGTTLQSFWALRNILIQLKKRYHSQSVRFICIDYGLAPENQYPTGLLQTHAAYDFFLKQGHKVILMGDSAGGHLALTVLIKDGLLLSSNPENNNLLKCRATGLLALSPSVHPLCYPRLNRYYSTHVNYDFLHPIHLKAFSSAFITGIWANPFKSHIETVVRTKIQTQTDSEEIEIVTEVEDDNIIETREINNMIMELPELLRNDIKILAPEMMDPIQMSQFLPNPSMIICGENELLFPDIRRFYEKVNEVTRSQNQLQKDLIQVLAIPAGVHDYAMLVPGKQSKDAMTQGVDYIAQVLNLSPI